MPDETQHIGPYPIEGELGRGGMGVVYLGRDQELGRQVAIKVLPEEFAADPERLARFDREAKLLASVSHPNIAGIYGVGEADGKRYLALEYVPGENLADRLARGPLPVPEALEVCAQIAAGLAAAHDAGVIHRDLKPGNVRLTPDGEVKLLDFGLAKGVVADVSSSSLDLSPTMTYEVTGAGILIGTAAYMSPEQARGKAVDRRTDLWALGCVLFECLTGEGVFRADTATGTLARILEREPTWEALPDGLPVKVRDLLRRCLEKDPRRRMRDAGDAHLELEEARSRKPVAASGQAVGEPTSRRWPVALVSAVLGAVVAIGLWNGLAEVGPEGAGVSDPVRLSIIVGEEETIDGYVISPDGAIVFYTTQVTAPAEGEAGSRSYLRSFGSFDARRLEAPHGIEWAAFSPDGESLAVFGTESRESSQSKLFRVSLDGVSPPLALADYEARWGGFTWPETEWLAVTTAAPKGVQLVAADGSGLGEALLIEEGALDGAMPYCEPVPGRRSLLCTVVHFGDRGYLHHAAVFDLETGATSILVEDAYSARLAPSGHLLFTRHDALYAAPLDLDSMTLAASPTPVLGELRVDNVYSGAWFQIASNGTLLYEPGGVMGARRRLATVGENVVVDEWLDRRPISEGPRVSPDGSRFGLTIIGETGLDEGWVADAESRSLRRVVTEPGKDCDLLGFTAANEVLYGCGDVEGGGAFLRDIEHDGEARLVLESSAEDWNWPRSISSDGSKLLYVRTSTDPRELRLVDLDKASDDESRDVLLLSDVVLASLSPDDAWIAYSTDVTGRREHHVRRLVAWDRLGPELPVTSLEVQSIWWAPGPAGDRPELRIRAADGQVSTVSVSDAGVSAPRPLPWVDLAVRDALSFGELPDGRFVMILKGEEETPGRQIDVVLNFDEELRRRFADTPR